MCLCLRVRVRACVRARACACACLCVGARACAGGQGPARDALRRALRAAPESPDALCGLGAVLAQVQYAAIDCNRLQ